MASLVEKNDGFCGKVGLDVFCFPTLHRFCHDVITALMCDDSSTSFRADSSDEDLVDEIFVNFMFPDYNHDYPRTNIEDLNESQCDAKSKHFV